jgi:antitoxin (DNA-binding transcriptional repressor) of toxin-antitoxin stability system
MKTLTVQEASESLSEWLRRAVRGEEIAIHEGDCTVLLQPLADIDATRTKNSGPREALRKLQSRARLTPEEAEQYLREVRDERLSE